MSAPVRPPAGGSQDHPHPAVSVIPREARPFQGRRAGIVSRLLANTVDFAVVAGVLTAGYLGLSATLFLWSPSSFRFPHVSTLALLLVGGGLLFCYLTVCWATTGRTYGDHLLGLRVVSFRGDRMRWAGAAVRAAACVAFPIGVLWVAVSPANRSLQDLLLRSSVVYDWGPEHAVEAHPS